MATDFFGPGQRWTSTDIVTGPDGNLWFTEQFGDKIARLDLVRRR